MLTRFLRLFESSATKNPKLSTVEAKFEHAQLLNQQGQTREANLVCQEILARNPEHFDSLVLAAECEATQGNLEAAIQLYTRIIEVRPDYPRAFYKRGNLLKDRNQLEEALGSYDQAVTLDPGYANAFCNRGVVLGLLDRSTEAVSSYDRAIALNPGDAFALYNRAGALRDLNELRDALAGYDQAILVRPDYAEAYCNRGIVLQELMESDAALASYDRSIGINPNVSAVHLNRGNLLRERRKMEEALASYNRAIEIDLTNAEAYSNRGVLFTDLRQWNAALADFYRAIELNAKLAEVYCYRGQWLVHMMRMEAAIADFDKAVALKPNYAEAFRNRADAFILMKQYEAGLASFDRAFSLKPDFPYLLGMRRHVRMQICDWSDLESDIDRLAAGIEVDETVSTCFPILGLLNSARLHQKVAQIWTREEHPADHSLLEIPRRSAGEKIRIGYFSVDFHEHPVALLAAEFLEMHNRSKFEVIAFSCGPDTQDTVRKRLESAFDQFIDVHGKSDREIALLARSMCVDIAVDLGGHTGNSRTRIFAQRAAPIQVNYLGYPGTMGAEYMDYLIGDPTVISEAQRPHYTEKIVYLPNSYLPHDSSRPIADIVFSREDLGLPLSGFVFCCFNNNYKITPDTFDGWMRILRRVENSVLWLSQKDPMSARNLRREAQRRGVDGERLIFADRMSSFPEHLARHRAADLFLDTLPYNAHATALDALWAGLPVLTCMGEGFVSRVAASLLNSLQMPELITTTAMQYESLAVELATNPKRLDEIRQKLARNRLTTPLFDTRAFTGHLEAAYAEMHERYVGNLPPVDFYVEA